MWRRKKKTEPAPVPAPKTPCELWGHLWQDFPWVIYDDYDKSNGSRIEIVEYYVCRICGKVEQKTILKSIEEISRKEHDAKLLRLKEEYKDHIKPIPVVLDMVNDMKMLDKERLAAWERLHSDINLPQDTRLKLGKEVFDS